MRHCVVLSPARLAAPTWSVSAHGASSWRATGEWPARISSRARRRSLPRERCDASRNPAAEMISFLHPGFLYAAAAASVVVVALHFLVAEQPRAGVLPTVRFFPDMDVRST